MSGELYTSDEKDALFRAQIRALNGGETVGAELLRLRKENAEMRKCLAEAVELAENITITITRGQHGRETEYHPADNSPKLQNWKRYARTEVAE